MPQAKQALRDEWQDDASAISYLEQGGYILTEQWFWLKRDDWKTTDRDLRAIDYLIQEWDFGGICGSYK